MKNRFALLLVCLLCSCTLPAHAYGVGPSKTLKVLTDESDIVVKATALQSRPVEDDGLKKMLNYAISSTQFEIVSVIKGTVTEKNIEFHHYSRDAQRMQIFPFNGMQPYTFAAGRTYLLWADATPDGSYRQTRAAATYYNQAVMLAGDAVPLADVTSDIGEIVWRELTTLLPSNAAAEQRCCRATLLPSNAAADTIYAISKLSQLSDGPFSNKDFERTRIARVLAPYFTAPDETVAYVALHAVDGPDAKQVQTELIAVANSNATVARRAAPLHCNL